jgi:hypothetical protein
MAGRDMWHWSAGPSRGSHDDHDSFQTPSGSQHFRSPTGRASVPIDDDDDAFEEPLDDAASGPEDTFDEALAGPGSCGMPMRLVVRKTFLEVEEQYDDISNHHLKCVSDSQVRYSSPLPSPMSHKDLSKMDISDFLQLDRPGAHHSAAISSEDIMGSAFRDLLGADDMATNRFPSHDGRGGGRPQRAPSIGSDENDDPFEPKSISATSLLSTLTADDSGSGFLNPGDRQLRHSPPLMISMGIGPGDGPGIVPVGGHGMPSPHSSSQMQGSYGMSVNTASSHSSQFVDSLWSRGRTVGNAGGYGSQLTVPAGHVSMNNSRLDTNAHAAGQSAIGRTPLNSGANPWKSSSGDPAYISNIGIKSKDGLQGLPLQMVTATTRRPSSPSAAIDLKVEEPAAASRPDAQDSQDAQDDVVDETPGTPVPRTTVMLRNLPEGFSRDMVTDMMKSEGFDTKVDFVYVPMNFRNKASFGYAFVNLVSTEAADACREKFEGFKNWPVPSKKVCEVSWSDMNQGLEAHIERYRNSPVMHVSVADEFKPAMFSNGVRASFPPPTKALRAPRIRRPVAPGEVGDDDDSVAC